MKKEAVYKLIRYAVLQHQGIDVSNIKPARDKKERQRRSHESERTQSIARQILDSLSDRVYTKIQQTGDVEYVYKIVGDYIRSDKMLKVDWNEIPKCIKYVAMDDSGYWFGYYARPRRNRTTWWPTVPDNLSGVHGLDSILFTGQVNWENSLMRRPESNELKTWRDVVNAILDGDNVMYEGVILDTPIYYDCLPEVNIEYLDKEVPYKHWIAEKITIEGGVISDGDYYFVPYHLDKERPYLEFKWAGNEFDQHCLDNKLACKTKELAIEKSKQFLNVIKEG